MPAMPLCQQGRFSRKEKRVLQFAGAEARVACAGGVQRERAGGYAADQFAPYPATIGRLAAIADAANLFAIAFAIDTGRACTEHHRQRSHNEKPPLCHFPPQNPRKRPCPKWYEPEKAACFHSNMSLKEDVGEGRNGLIILKMVTDMNETQLHTIEQIKRFLSGSALIEFSTAGNDSERRAGIGERGI